VKPALDPVRTDPAAYPFHRHLPLKYADQDAAGEVGGVAVGRLFEEARYGVRRSVDCAEARDPDIAFVLARVRVDLLEPLHYPGSVDVGIGVAATGRTSITYASGLFQDGRLHAVSEATVALRDISAGRGHQLGPQLRQALDGLRLRPGSPT
jgi:acyl-CoA thioester hydrolase